MACHEITKSFFRATKAQKYGSSKILFDRSDAWALFHVGRVTRVVAMHSDIWVELIKMHR